VRPVRTHVDMGMAVVEIAAAVVMVVVDTDA
jgi:hypothetical protein